MVSQFFGLSRASVRRNALRYFPKRFMAAKTVNQTEYASATNLSLLRNIGISAHIDSGKTTTTERILFYTNRIQEIHEVRGRDGVGAKMDSMELEKERGITIKSAATHTEWKGHHVNIIDTPGHVDFTVEVERSLFVLDGAVLLICGASGIQSQSITVDRQMKRYDVPRVIFINKLDRIQADPFRVYEQARKELGLNAQLVQIPIGLENEHRGVVDLITQEALYFEGEDGIIIRKAPIPENLIETAEEYKWKLIEALGDCDDDMAMKFLDEEMPSEEEIKAAIRKYTISREFVPVFMGASFKNKGVQPMLDGVIQYLPSPIDVEHKGVEVNQQTGEEKPYIFNCTDKSAPIVALAFKLESGKSGQLTWLKIYQGTLKIGSTLRPSGDMKKHKAFKVSKLCRMHSAELQDIQQATAGDIVAMVGIDCYSGTTFTDGRVNLKVNPMHIPQPVVSMAVVPKDQQMAIKLSTACERFMKEDPTFIVSANAETGERVLNGMGELHLEVYVERLFREYGIACTVSPPKVNYREKIGNYVEFDYLHKKQSGGHGQYGRVIGKIEPLPEGSKDWYVFETDVKGKGIPKEYWKSVGEGFREQGLKGPLCGGPIVNLKSILNDGAFHDVDSSDLSFKLAAKGAFRANLEKLGMTIIEPYMTIEASCPAEFEDSVIGTLCDRRCQIENVDRNQTQHLIKCCGPLSQMFGYITSLRKATQGKGEFSMEYRDHQNVDMDIQLELMAAYQVKLDNNED